MTWDAGCFAIERVGPDIMRTAMVMEDTPVISQMSFQIATFHAARSARRLDRGARSGSGFLRAAAKALMASRALINASAFVSA
jgi:hypothetical protein